MVGASKTKLCPMTKAIEDVAHNTDLHNGHCYVMLQDISTLNQAHCKIKNPARLQNIINDFICAGPERLQVVSDFDYTITKQRLKDGTPMLTSFGIFNSCKALPANYTAETKKLYNKYSPIEIDPYMTKTEKTKHMHQWWSRTGDLLFGFTLDQNDIDSITSKYKDSLRDHSEVLFEALNRLQIPVFVFSAGLTIVLESMLKHAKLYFPNIRIISNNLKYENGLLNGFHEPVIHTLNKNSTVLKNSEYDKLQHTRDHIFVLGDSLGDAAMADGVTHSANILKIGFLFHHVEENLSKYMDAFDIVLIDDQTMRVPCELLSFIEKHHRNVSAKYK